jgi:hypothetical protein
MTSHPPTGLHVRYEKAGLILDALPIPWNADAVIVEANIRLPKETPSNKRDFTSRVADGHPITAELIVGPTKQSPMRVFFRIPVPAQTSIATVYWSEHSLGQVELPIINQGEIDAGITLSMPTVHVVLGERTVACRSFVSAQAKSLLASAVVQSASPLAAVLNLGLRVEFTDQHSSQVGSVEVAFTSEQLRQRQALDTVQIPKPRAVGVYEVAWHLGSRCLHRHKIAVVSRKTLVQSLRISATRFHVIRTDGTSETVRTLPTRDGQLALDGIKQVAPIFFVCSSEPGMAGLVPFTLRAWIDDQPSAEANEDDVLVTDGPTPIALGISEAESLARTQHFTLAAGERVLGNLTPTPAPQADFSGEGGFAALDDFLWSPAAEELLNDRLGKLLNEG